jgi:hypothetical protein
LNCRKADADQKGQQPKTKRAIISHQKPSAFKFNVIFRTYYERGGEVNFFAGIIGKFKRNYL